MKRVGRCPCLVTFSHLLCTWGNPGFKNQENQVHVSSLSCLYVAFISHPGNLPLSKESNRRLAKEVWPPSGRFHGLALGPMAFVPQNLEKGLPCTSKCLSFCAQQPAPWSHPVLSLLYLPGGPQDCWAYTW